ncbi:glycoside hydrolase family 43 protein [Actinomadura opuntiae]|uniref:glycoside hydrolase family 43 protein n=1 Tax=Actinomadura sp. OS1-43 TaxID=604315 RepID=UPI00255A95F8|nr:glycoside hydrolase family 43 protein [Actinomadura sp. OS1-43]MDL4821828.1 family 43 glycosylhydrolase [Actinomadura sp. OS1-43]
MSTIVNPVVRGLAPDPSLCRVGDDFYLATSTFDFLPGIRIHHSTDLVNWRLLGGAVTRPAQYRRDGEPGELMLYAPTIRHHDGRFYLACTNFSDGQGNFLLSAEDPAGEWSDAVWIDTHAFDPSLLFADGTCYYTRRTLEPLPDGRLGPVVQCEIDPATGRMLGPMRELTPDYAGFCSNDIEGPHLYKIDDWYYLFSAEGGSWKGHMQTCARSRSPWGPFEPCPHNPVLTHRHRVGHPIQTVGHAELIDAPDGSWWALTLGTRHEARNGFVYHHNLGRETFLAPVEWTPDGWPVIGENGTIEMRMATARPLPSAKASTVRPPKTIWAAGWTTQGLPVEGLTGGQGDFTLPFARPLDSDDRSSGIGAVFLPQQEDAAGFTATLQAAPGTPAEAGIAVHSSPHHYYALLVTTGPGGGRETVLRRRVDDMITESRAPLPGTGSVGLSITATAETYTLHVAEADRPPRVVGSGSARLLSAETAEAFVGCRFALVATGDDQCPAARFTDVAVSWDPV